MRNFYKKAFTLSEVLLALALVGIIAAMVIPGTMHHANQKMLTAQIKNTVVALQDMAQEQISASSTKMLVDTDFVSADALLTSGNFDIARKCTDTDICWADAYKTLSSSSVSVSQAGILLKNGVAINYEIIENPDDNPYSDTNTKEHYYGTFFVDVNGVDKPNLLGRDLFIFKITDKGRIGGNLANENSKDDLKTACRNGSDTSACHTYLELNGWNMDY